MKFIKERFDLGLLMITVISILCGFAYVKLLYRFAGVIANNEILSEVMTYVPVTCVISVLLISLIKLDTEDISYIGRIIISLCCYCVGLLNGCVFWWSLIPTIGLFVLCSYVMMYLYKEMLLAEKRRETGDKLSQKIDELIEASDNWIRYNG